MKKFKKPQDSHFDINLAPMLDVIVAIIPLLLLSLAFINVNMIETEVPQLVTQAIENNKNDPKEATLSIEISDKEVKMVVTQNSNKKEVRVGTTPKGYDFEKLYQEALVIKKSYPSLFRAELKPTPNVSLEKIVGVMDSIRKSKDKTQFTFKDSKSGQEAQTDLMFPDIVFSAVTEGA